MTKRTVEALYDGWTNALKRTLSGGRAGSGRSGN
jgi:hypothetical protein